MEGCRGGGGGGGRGSEGKAAVPGFKIACWNCSSDILAAGKEVVACPKCGAMNKVPEGAETKYQEALVEVGATS